MCEVRGYGTDRKYRVNRKYSALGTEGNSILRTYVPIMRTFYRTPYVRTDPRQRVGVSVPDFYLEILWG